MSSPSSRAAAIARLAAIAATMTAVPAVVAGVAGPAEAATAPPVPTPAVGAAPLTHLSTLLGQGATVELTAAHGVHQDTVEPNPFHQFHQFHEGPFRQGTGFDQFKPFHQAPPPVNPPPDPFQQLSQP
ncbi:MULTISPECIES: hypothetical protein [unclassified Nocardia]|uniref:hypothetical protein n=1 Tax=unclassified Nocardia TaxID=2637762 RepID=UPI001CE45DDC|nr:MULTISPECIES: hypothetical protein [unclassified Nocardia]